MAITRVFQNGNSQALRIPQEMRTDIKEYTIRKIGEAFIAYPTNDSWAPTRDLMGSFPDNYMDERSQPSISEASKREDL